MHLLVQKTEQLSGCAMPPSSKSQSIRGIILASLVQGESTLINPLDSSDMQDAIHVCKQLGTDITVFSDKIHIVSKGLPLHTDFPSLNTGNSGITTRFILPLLGLRENTDPVMVDCGEQMRARPIHSLVNALNHLGLNITYVKENGRFPLSVSGQLLGGRAVIEGLTSQYLSALLIALPCALQDSEISVKNLHERPYMEMTLQWLIEQNIRFRHQRTKDTDSFYITGRQRYQSFQKMIAGDFSSASYLIATAVMLPGLVELKGLDMQDPQGDKRLIPILQEMGADILITPQSLIIQGGKPLQGIKIYANDIPDLLPTLAVVGTYATGKTEICDVAQARIKETDRIHSMTEGLRNLNAKIEEYKDGMTIYQSTLKGATVSGFDDHRTVMALALAGMLASGTTRIEGCEAINKTFPNFVTLMQSLGAKMEMGNA